MPAEGKGEESPRGRKGKDQPPVQLDFSLALGTEVPRPFRLCGTSQRICIGRRSDADITVAASSVSYDHCELYLKRKGRDPVLCVRDLSKNGTGVRDARSAAKGEEFSEVGREEVEVLHHKSQLLVPARSIADKDQRKRVTVIFDLPDAYCPHRGAGRWDYEERLGEGGLAVVYRARDMKHGGRLVAVKVSKFGGQSANPWENRHIYALHREARWSMERLHNPADRRYERGGAALFVTYLEDHTGFARQQPHGDFDAMRQRFEDPAFAWAKFSFDPPLNDQPYVVLEFVEGKLLQHIIDKGCTPLGEADRAMVIRQCCKALVYLERFGVLHRDFRGCNIFLESRGNVKVIDLGFMISADPAHERNPNPAVRCAWQGEHEGKAKFDWAPPEVRAQRGAPNFGLPPFSFDIFSFAVLVLKLLKGRVWAQETLQCADAFRRLQSICPEVEEVGLAVEAVVRMLGAPEKRPSASQVFAIINKRRPRPKREPAEKAGGSSGGGTLPTPSGDASLAKRPRLEPSTSASIAGVGASALSLRLAARGLEPPRSHG